MGAWSNDVDGLRWEFHAEGVVRRWCLWATGFDGFENLKRGPRFRTPTAHLPVEGAGCRLSNEQLASLDWKAECTVLRTLYNLDRDEHQRLIQRQLSRRSLLSDHVSSHCSWSSCYKANFCQSSPVVKQDFPF
jgi:hypothetical protein